MKCTTGMIVILVIITIFNFYLFVNFGQTKSPVIIPSKIIEEKNPIRINVNKNNNEDKYKDLIEIQNKIEENLRNILIDSLEPLSSQLKEASNLIQLNKLNQLKESTQKPAQIFKPPEKPNECFETVKEKIIYQNTPNWDEEMAKLDWNVVGEAMKLKLKRLPKEWVEDYLYLTIPFLEEVKGPLIDTIAPPLVVDCKRKDYVKFLTGNRRKQSVRVFDLTEMAYELDTLEIRLFELEDVVDEFVLLEGMFTHTGIKKPLFLERNMDRYERWRNKITHFIWDERMAMGSDRLNNEKYKFNDWSLEVKSREYLMQAFLDLHNDGKDLRDDDLFILGDLDEIPQRDVIAHLKHCEVKENFFPVTFHSTFWRFSFHWKMDDVCECPSIVTWQNLRDDKVPLRGSFDSRIMDSAWHLNRFGPAIMQVVKEFSVAEGHLTIPGNNPETLRNITYAQYLMDKGVRPCCPRDKLRHTNDALALGYDIPWIIYANIGSGRWDFV